MPRPKVRRSARAARRGFAARRLLLALVAVVAPAVLLAVVLTHGWSGPAAEEGPLLHRVARGEFLHDITERGELESASNVEIRCEVKAMNTPGTQILDIVPEGTLVKAGDVVCRLDSSALENDRTRQQISVATSQAEVIRARTAFETAKMAREEYLKGTYTQLVQTAEGDQFSAQENLRKAEEYLRYSQMLHRKGYITDQQLKADSFAAEKAKADLEAAQTKLRVLTDYTRRKMLAQLDSDIQTTEAKLQAQLHSHELETNKLADIETQLAKCTVRAPSPGQVVYANISNSWGGKEAIIEPGCIVRERQEIVRLPDHTKMQVRAKINESRVALISAGMSAVVRLDAFPDREFRGEVEHVNEYPAPSNRFTSSAKEYETVIRMIDPPPSARPGLTAEVRIHVEYLTDVLQVPVQAVFEHDARQYCLLPAEEGPQPVQIEVGSTNDKYVVVRKGLSEGQPVVLNAAALRAKAGMGDDLAAKRTVAASERQPPAGDERRPAAATQDAAAGGDPPTSAPTAGAVPVKVVPAVARPQVSMQSAGSGS